MRTTGLQNKLLVLLPTQVTECEQTLSLLKVRSSGLPAPLTPLIGREQDVVAPVLGHPRMLGPGMRLGEPEAGARLDAEPERSTS